MELMEVVDQPLFPFSFLAGKVLFAAVLITLLVWPWTGLQAGFLGDWQLRECPEHLYKERMLLWNSILIFLEDTNMKIFFLGCELNVWYVNSCS